MTIIDGNPNTELTNLNIKGELRIQGVLVPGSPGTVTSTGTLTNNSLVRGNGGVDIDVSNITVSTDGNDLSIPGTLTTVGTLLGSVAILDNNIELGVVSTPTDATADGGGITLKGTTDKTIIWVDATDSWTFNQQLDAGTNKIINVVDPTLAQDAATKNYVDTTPSLPGGADTQVQFNNSGVLDGSANFVFDGTKVGIGTASPEQNLHIISSGSTGITSAPTRGLALTDATAPRIMFEDSSETADDKIMAVRYSAQNLTFSSLNDGGTITQTDDILVLNRDGNIGIGTMTPEQKLHVNVSGTSLYTAASNRGIIITDSTAPRIVFEDAGEAVDKKIMVMSSFGQNIQFASQSDDGGTSDVANILVINRDGNVGIGTGTPQAGLHGVVTNGALLWADTEADATQKTGRWGVQHFTNAEEPFFGIVHVAQEFNNILNLGGGTAFGNAATELQFSTAANNTTTGGTVRLTIDSAGNAVFTNDVAAPQFVGTQAGGGSDAAIRVQSIQPSFSWRETDATLDNKAWDIIATAEQLDFRVVNDANSAASNYMEVQRTGVTIDSVTFPNGDVGIGVSSPNQKLHVLTSGTSGATSLLNRGILLTDNIASSITFEDSGEAADKKIMRMESFDQKIAFSSLNDVGDTVDVANILEIGRDGVIQIDSSILMRAANSAAIMSDTQTLGFRRYYNYIGSAATVDWTINTVDMAKASVSRVWEFTFKDKAGVASVANPINIIAESGFIDFSGTTQVSITTNGGSISFFCDGTNIYTVN